MLLTLTLALLTSLCALQGVSEGRPVITSVSASYRGINITASDNPPIQPHSVFNIYVYRRQKDQDSLYRMINPISFQRGWATVHVPLDPFIFYAVEIVEYFQRTKVEAESGSDKVPFKRNDTISVKNIRPREMTVEFPKIASSGSVIEGYSIAYTTEGLEDFISKGNAVVYRQMTTLKELEEGAKYSITVKPRTNVQYHLEAGHTVQQTLPIAPGASPRNLTGFGLNSSAVQISWMPPPSREWNGEIISYEIRLRGSSSGISLNTSSDSDRMNWTYIITGLNAGVTYEIEVAARNIAGTGIYKSVNVRTNDPVTSPPPPTSPMPSQTSPMMSPSPTPSPTAPSVPTEQGDPLSWLYIVVPVGTMAVILAVITLVITFFVCKVRKMATGEPMPVHMNRSEGNLDDSNVYIGQHIYEDPDQCMEEYRVNAMVQKLSEVEPHSHTSHPSGRHNDRSANGLLNGGGYATLEMGSATDYTRNDDPELFGKQLQQSLPADYEKPWTTTTSGHYEYDEGKFSGSQDEMPRVQDYEAPIPLNGDVKDESSTIINDDVRDGGLTAINQNGIDGEHTTINDGVRNEEHTAINEDERDSGNYSPNSTEENHEQDKRGSGIYL